MSENDRRFTRDEVRVLIYYAYSLFSEMNDNLFKTLGDRERYEVGFRRLVRRYARLTMFPELILSEQPKSETKPREGGRAREKCSQNAHTMGMSASSAVALNNFL